MSVDNQADIEQSIIDWNNGHERFGNINLKGTPLKRLRAPELNVNLKAVNSA